MGSWVKTKVELADVQKESYLLEHKTKLEFMKKKFEKEIELLEEEHKKKMQQLLEEHNLKMEILQLQKQKFSR